MNFLYVGLTDNHLLTSNNDLLINKADKDKKKSTKNNTYKDKDNSNLNSKNKTIKDYEVWSIDKSILFFEDQKSSEELYNKKKEIKEKRYIVDNIDNFSRILLYGIFWVTTYFWIFLLLTKKICNNINTKVNIILYNNSFNLHYYSFKSYHDLFVEKNWLIKEYYRPFFLRYSELLKKEKILSKFKWLISDKINFGIILSLKEQWNILYE